MFKIEDREKISSYFDDYKALNIRGILKNTDYQGYVDDLSSPKSIWMNDHYFNFLYTKDHHFIKACDEKLNESFYAFSGTNDEVLSYYRENALIHWQNTCSQFHYVGDKFLDVEPLESLRLEDAEYVNEHYEYQNEHSLEKIKTAIGQRPSSCKRVDGKIVSFVMLHDDDSIGYMFTLPEYRGRGYAYELTKDIINKTIDSGRLPYVQIVKGNYKSEQLAIKSGFVKHGEVHWFGVVKEGKELEQYLEHYQKCYEKKALSMSVKITLDQRYEPLDVIVHDDSFEYEGRKYPYLSEYYDEVYFMDVDMPEDIFISGMMKLMKEDHEIVFVNQFIEASCFKALSK